VNRSSDWSCTSTNDLAYWDVGSYLCSPPDMSYWLPTSTTRVGPTSTWNLSPHAVTLIWLWLFGGPPVGREASRAPGGLVARDTCDAGRPRSYKSRYGGFECDVDYARG
jgi:hypothetical protein